MEDMVSRTFAFFTQLQHWHWWIAGLLLGILEVILPGFFFAGVAVACFLTGLVALIFSDMSWQYQMVTCAILTAVSVVIWRQWIYRASAHSGDDHLNRRGSEYIGRIVILDKPVQNGSVTLKLDGLFWKATGPNLPVGTKVRITGLDGTTFQFEQD